jgi:acetyl-CoA acetyltransferase
MAREAADKAYAEAGVGPKDVQVVELHDCFATNELLTYEAL